MERLDSSAFYIAKETQYTPYNIIFQLHTVEKNNKEIVRLIGDVSKKTVITVFKLAEEFGFTYPTDNEMSDLEIQRTLPPKKQCRAYGYK